MMPLVWVPEEGGYNHMREHKQCESMHPRIFSSDGQPWSKLCVTNKIIFVLIIKKGKLYY